MARRTNIQRHYDLSNDFYRLWLDQRMLYTCAYFPTPDASLEEAQEAKLELVCRKLCLRPGRNRGRSRLRLGSAGHLHGATLWRQREGVQHFA